MDGRGWGTASDTFSDLRISVQARLREYITPLIIVKDGKIKKDYPIENPRDAAEELRNMPAVIEDEDED